MELIMTQPYLSKFLTVTAPWFIKVMGIQAHGMANIMVVRFLRAFIIIY